MNYNEALNAVKNITAYKGTAVLYDKDKMPSLFKKFAPALTDEYDAIKIFYDNDLHKAFSETLAKDPEDCENTINVLKRRLVSEFAVDAALADEIVTVLTKALGWSTEKNEQKKAAAIDALTRRVMNNKKKLYILLAIGVAVVAAAILLYVSLPGGFHYKHGKTQDNITPEVQTESASPENNAAPDNSEDDKDDSDGGVQIEIPVEELGKLVDAADEAYKSFEVLPVDSTDFFLGKKLRLVATLQDDDSGSHTMTFLYEQNITATITDGVLMMNYKDSDGADKTLANYVYAAPTEPFTSPGGRKFAIVAFGDHDITEENKEFSTDCFMLIKMRDDVDMSIAPSDTYVMLIESAMPETYELFKVEE